MKDKLQRPEWQCNNDQCGKCMQNTGLVSAANNGVLTINATQVTNSGRMFIGVGSLVTVQGSLVSTSTTRYEFEVSGVQSSAIGRLNVSLAMQMAGTLETKFVGGFAPALNDEFQLIVFASAIGTFSDVVSDSLPIGLDIAPVYSPTNFKARSSMHRDISLPTFFLAQSN